MQGVDATRLSLEFAHEFIKPFAEDLKDEPMKRAIAGGNHAMWIVGHEAVSEASLLGMLTGEPSPLKAWDELFQGGSTPIDDASAYPAYDEVLAAMHTAAETTLAFVGSIDDAKLDERPLSAPETEMPFFKTVGTVLHFIATHKMTHWGQLADIRKTLGRKPIFG